MTDRNTYRIPLHRQGRPSGEGESQTKAGRAIERDREAARRMEEDRTAEQRRDRDGEPRGRVFIF